MMVDQEDVELIAEFSEAADYEDWQGYVARVSREALELLLESSSG